VKLARTLRTYEAQRVEYLMDALGCDLLDVGLALGHRAYPWSSWTVADLRAAERYLPRLKAGVPA
jgi:hypothetical protein